MSGLRWATLSRAIMQLITWSATFLVVRLLSPADYGLVTMATVLSSYLVLLGEFGFGTVLVQKRTTDDATLRFVLGALIITGSLLFVVAAFSGPLVARYFKEPALTALCALSAAQFLIMPFLVIPTASLAIQLRFRAMGIAGVASAAAGAACTLAMAYAGFGAYSLVAGILVTSAARAIAVNVMAPFLKRPRFSYEAIRDLIGFSGIVLTQRSIWYWYAEADGIIVGTALGAKSLGIFAMAKQLAAIPQERFAEIMNTVALPVFAAVQDDRQRVKDGFIKAMRIGATVAIPVFAGLALVAEDLLHLVIGRKWDAAIPVLQLLCVSMPLRSVASIVSPTVTAIGKPGVSLKFVIWVATCVPVLMLVGVHWGLIGVAMAWAVGYPIAFVGGLMGVAKALNASLRELLLPFVRPTLCAALMCGVVLLIASMLLQNVPSIARLGVNVLVGAASYTLALRLLAYSSFTEIVAFGSAFFSGKSTRSG